MLQNLNSVFVALNTVLPIDLGGMLFHRYTCTCGLYKIHKVIKSIFNAIGIIHRKYKYCYVSKLAN